MNELYKPQILKLRKEGKTYTEIVKIVGCAYSTVSYYLSGKVRENAKKRTKKNRTIKPKDRLTTIIQQKLQSYNSDNKSGAIKKYYPTLISVNDLRKILLNDPKCYLTGNPIDPLNSSSWSLDHIIPRSKGGKNTPDNLGLTCSIANRCKHDLMLNDFLNFCKTILENFGYKVTGPEES